MTYLLVGCGLKYIDAPNAPAALSWKKEGYTQRMNEIELSKCGYPIRNYATKDEYIKLRIIMEQCMLYKGFKYSATYWQELTDIDFPKRNACDSEINMKYPGCQSLK